MFAADTRVRMFRAERTRRAERTPDLSVAGSIQTLHEGGDPYAC